MVEIDGAPDAQTRGSAKRSAPFPRTIQNLLLYLYVSLRTYLSTAWIKINRWLIHPDSILVRPPLDGPLPPAFHKAVIVGDGFALGMGDAGVMLGDEAGVAPHLLQCAELDPNVRRTWRVVSRGEMDGRTEAWLPGSGRLYESVFGPDKAGRDAEVVIIMMGTADVVAGVDGLPPPALSRDMTDVPYPPDELSSLAKNVGALAGHLQRKGTRVCVVDLPTRGTPGGAGRGKMRRLNQQLKQVVGEVNRANGLAVDAEKVSAETTRDGDKNGQKAGRCRVLYPIQYVALGDNHRLMRCEFTAWDGLHFNRTGYKSLALDMFANDGVKSMMVNAEWSIWKNALRKDGLPEHQKSVKDKKQE